MITFFDWFAGIGGFRIGFEKAGMRCVGACELNRYARKVYKRRFGHFPQFRDIRDVQAVEIGRMERPTVWCGGFPCQGISQAGLGGAYKMRGLVFGGHGISLSEKPYPKFLSLKTRHFCIREDLRRYSNHLKRSGMYRSGKFYRLVGLARHTCGDDCSSFPTPTASMARHGWGFHQSTKKRYKKRILLLLARSGTFPHPELQEVLMGFPTGWSDLNVLEIPYLQSSQNTSGGK